MNRTNLNHQNNLGCLDKAMDFRTTGNGFDPRFDHKKVLNLSDCDIFPDEIIQIFKSLLIIRRCGR
jgi:hypothetical protein